MNDNFVTKLKPFNGNVLEDLLTDISLDANAILALGALLQSADLGENFGNELADSRKYREGLTLDRAFKTSRKTQRRRLFFLLMFGKIQSDHALSAFEQSYFDSLIEKDRRKTAFLIQAIVD